MTTTAEISRKPSQVAIFLDLIKFAHSIFALPFALIATFWAFKAVNVPILSGPALGRLGLILLCMVAARTFAMTFNRLVDRRYDGANPRTAKRPSVTGAVSVGFMRATLAVTVVIFVAGAGGFWLFFENVWPLVFCVPVLAVLATYSYTKRFTALCHFWLGICLGLAPVSAWIAIAGSGASPFTAQMIPILLLGLGVAFWLPGFDILYALQDEDFDRTQNLYSIPAKFGRRKALVISRLCHALTIAAFALVGVTGNFHLLYWLGFSAAVALLIIEQSLVSEKDISKINLAFMTANGLIGILFGALAIADSLVY